MQVDRGHDSFDRRLAAVGTLALVDVRLELGAVLVDVAPDRPDGEVAERAQRPALDAIAHVAQQIEVRMRRATRLYLLEQADHPARPLAARRALPARLVHVELLGAQGELNHAGPVVDD